MISFNKLNDKGTDYKLVFGNGKAIDIFLKPKGTLTNKFGIIKSSIQKMSEVMGQSFDEFIFRLLSNYQNCDSDDHKYDLLHKNIDTITKSADFFVECNGVDYGIFANERKKSEYGFFFDEDEIKKIMKVSESFKIYSLFSNTEVGLSQPSHKKIYNEIIDLLKANEVISKIFKFLGMLIEECERTRRNFYYEDPSFYWSIKYMRLFNTITNTQIIVCEYDRNPIPFFIEIIKNEAGYRDKSKQKGISYVDIGSERDNDDKFVSYAREHIDLKTMYIKDLLNKLEQISFSSLVNFYNYQTEKKSPKDREILLKTRLNQIKHISPFWQYIIVPILSKATAIDNQFLEKQSPKRAALMSFYLCCQLNGLFNKKFMNLFSLANYYPESEVPESTTYRLKNVSHFINSTLGFSNYDLMETVGNRVMMARLIENFVGRMKTRTVTYINILSGQPMEGIDFKLIEVEAINYLTRFFSDNLKTEIHRLENIILNCIK